MRLGDYWKIRVARAIAQMNQFPGYLQHQTDAQILEAVNILLEKSRPYQSQK